MSRSLQVAWRVGVWLGFNLGAQVPPIAYLAIHRDHAESLWEYVNCSLALIIAIGIFMAVLSDLVTEKSPPVIFGWIGLVVVLVLLLAFLQRTLHDEFLKGGKPDTELLVESAVVLLLVVGLGTTLKAGIWYEQAT